MAVYKRPNIIRINENIYEKMQFLAIKEHREINNQVEHALENYIEEYEKKYGEIVASR